MKKIFKTALFCFGLIALGSCEHDPDPVVEARPFALRSSQAGSSIVLQPQQDADAAVTLDWDRSVNGNFTSISTYRVAVSEAGDYANQVIANNGEKVPDEVSYTLTVQELNALVNRLPGYACGVPMSIDIRIQSTLGEGAANPFLQYSNAISLTVTPYSTKAPTLAFATSAGASANSQRLAASGVLATDYEGFVYLEPGTYQFFQPDACGDYAAPTVFGISGGNSGTLTAGGTGTYSVITAGHFFIRANTDAGTLSYTIAPFSGTQFGIFGRATRIFGFANTSPMTYNPGTNTWSTNIELINGKKFGFKTNNGAAPAAVLVGSGTATLDTPLNLSIGTGPVNNDGTINAPGTYVDDNTKTNYTVTVDLSTPRNYTFTLTKLL